MSPAPVISLDAEREKRKRLRLAQIIDLLTVIVEEQRRGVRRIR